MKYALMWMLVWGHPDAAKVFTINAESPGYWTHTEAECKARLKVKMAEAETPVGTHLWCVPIQLGVKE
jgi:hypothetical protein